MYAILKRIFNAVGKQSGIGLIVDALFGNFAYLHNLYIVLERFTNFVLIHFGRQPLSTEECKERGPISINLIKKHSFNIQFVGKNQC